MYKCSVGEEILKAIVEITFFFYNDSLLGLYHRLDANCACSHIM